MTNGITTLLALLIAMPAFCAGAVADEVEKSPPAPAKTDEKTHESPKPTPGSPMPPLSPELKREVEKEIAELAADDFSRREEAASALLRIGPPAIPLLENTRTNDPEQAYRINEILVVVRERRTTPRATLSGHSRPIIGLAVSPDGKFLASSAGQVTGRQSEETEVWIWNLERREVVTRVGNEEGPVRSLRWSSAGNWIGGALMGGDAFVWDASTGKVHRRLRTGGLATRSFAFVSSDPTTPPNRVAVGTETGWVILFDLQSGRETRRWASLGDPLPVDVWASNDGKTLFAAHAGKPLEEIAVDGSHERRKLARGEFAVIAAGGSSDELGIIQATGSYVGVPYASQTGLRTVQFPITGNSTAVARSAASKRIAVARQNTWSLFDSDTGRVIQNGFGHRGQIDCVEFAPNGQTFHTGGHDGSIVVWPVNAW